MKTPDSTSKLRRHRSPQEVKNYVALCCLVAQKQCLHSNKAKVVDRTAECLRPRRRRFARIMGSDRKQQGPLNDGCTGGREELLLDTTSSHAVGVGMAG
ncbi:hypothetical protein AVEN_125568-1 [Araneus ventricosus]|uniref:Uncharacterized protein n=1 Tax=Araneus ventricosus TaxID=182803 RepID=A0A4Y2NHP4_ARAVE|nr:hypothetical protein AVEN_125568-1 [Araneus ventricosus]